MTVARLPGPLPARVEVRLYAGLNDHLPAADRQRPFHRTLERDTTLAELAAALGIAAGEVGLALVNGTPAGLDAELRDGDRVALYPPLVTLAGP